MNVQTSVFQKEKAKTCAFTGHRETDAAISCAQLKKEIVTLIENGVETFYDGGAKGFDLLAAETVLELKKIYPNIKLCLCIPCPDQEKNYSAEDKERYCKVCAAADEKKLLFDHYFRGCMLARDRYMADNADVLLAYCKKTTGGTAYTVSYFSKKYPHKEIVFI